MDNNNQSWRVRNVAREYGCEFVDLEGFQIQPELLRKLPAGLVFRYNFVPLEETSDGALEIAIADPSQLMMLDEISLQLGKRILTAVSSLKEISNALSRTGQGV